LILIQSIDRTKLYLIVFILYLLKTKNDSTEIICSIVLLINSTKEHFGKKQSQNMKRNVSWKVILICNIYCY